MKPMYILVFLLEFIFIKINSFANPPEICRLQGGNTKTIWGTGFTLGNTEVYVASFPFEKDVVVSALEANLYYKGSELLPLQPPLGSKKLNILSTDPRGLVMAVEFSDKYNGDGFFDYRVEAQVVWVKNADGFSKPWLVHSADTYFVYPEKTYAGEEVRIFGRNINAKLIALRKVGDKKVQLLTLKEFRYFPYVHNESYETRVSLPKELVLGCYELFVHNGCGGVGGWSQPVKIVVQKQKNEELYFEAKEYGVKADGHTDDTKALKSALKVASKTGGVVSLQAGRVIISETIELPAGVSLCGAGEGATSLQVLDNNPMKNDFPEAADLDEHAHGWLPTLKGNGYAPMIWARQKSTVSDLTLIYGKGVGFGIMIARCPGISEDIHIERIKVIGNEFLNTWLRTFPIFVAGNTYGMVIKNNEFDAYGAIDIPANKHYQAYIGRNKCVCMPTGNTNGFLTRGLNESIVESNEISYGLRTYASQNGTKPSLPDAPKSKTFPTSIHRSTVHMAMIGNVYSSNMPRRHNAGEIMIEAPYSEWNGKVLKADNNSITVEGEPFDVDLSENYVVVLDGKGLGQYRRIVSNTVNKLILEKTWDVLPDETTFISIGGFNVEHLWIDNTITENASWVGYWGNHIGHVIDGQIMRNGGPLYLWAYGRDKNPGVVAFVDIIGSRTIGGGGIGFMQSPVFGNSIRFCEVVDFRYYPTFHEVPAWLAKYDPNDRVMNVNPMERFAIGFSSLKPKSSILPGTAPVKGWNVIEGNNIYDGPNGIYIDSTAQNTIIKHNVINVDKSAIVNESKTTIIK